LEFRWNDQGGIDGVEAPVEEGDENFEWGRGYADDVLGQENIGGEGKVREGAEDEGCRGEGEADYGQILKVPAV
jgi:hypothetical protein